MILHTYPRKIDPKGIWELQVHAFYKVSQQFPLETAQLMSIDSCLAVEKAS